MGIEWNPTMSTGIAVIDEDHQEWIRRFNNFDEIVVNNQSRNFLREALDFFNQYAEYHFPHEEKFAESFTNPWVEKNKKEHASYRQKIRRIEELLDSFGETITEIMALKLDMEQWLVSHISDTDVRLFHGAASKESSANIEKV